MRNILFALLWVCPCMMAFAFFQNPDDYCFSHITCENGLSQNNVKAIVQDRYGFIWLGTKNGLDRFDGKTMVRKVCEDRKAQKEGRDISALCAGRNGALWVGTGNGVFCYDPESDRFVYLEAKTKEGIRINSWVLNIVEDEDGSVWIVVPEQGVFRYVRGKLQLYKVVEGKQMQECPVSHLLVRRNGEVWLSTWGAGLFRYDKSSNRFVRLAMGEDGGFWDGKKMVMMCEYDGSVVLGTHEGRLFKYVPGDLVPKEMECPGLQDTYIRCLCVVGGKLWVGTYKGIFVVDGQTGSSVCLTHNGENVQSLSDNVVCAFYADEDSGLWVGTMYGGVDYMPCPDVHFSKYMTGNVRHFPERVKVRGMAVDGLGRIWIGTENAGIYRLDLEDGGMTRMVTGAERRPSVLFMSYSEQKVYCGVFQDGLWVIDPLTGDITRHSSKSLRVGTGDVYAFLTDRRGVRWLGTDRGLYKAEPGTLDFRRVDEVGRSWVFCLLEARDGDLWIGTMGDGLWVRDGETGKFRRYGHGSQESNALVSNNVTSVMQSRSGDLWVATERGGLCKYNADTDDFTTFSMKEGLPDDVVYGILEDRDGVLWLGTNRGLVSWDGDRTWRNFTTVNGLPANQFNYQAVVEGAGGRLYFGTVDGMVAFEPKGVRKESKVPPLYFTSLTVNNEEVRPGVEGSPLSRSIGFANEIELPCYNANIGLTVALLSYPAAFTTRYFYRLEPLDGEWVQAENNRVVYATLPVGQYRLQVKAVDGHSGVEVLRELSVTVLPPWWRTSWAYGVYVVVILALVWFSAKVYRRRQERRLRIRQHYLEMEKQKELYEAKTDFFTWVATGMHPPLQLHNERDEPENTAWEVLPLVGINEKEREWANRVIRTIEGNLMDETFNVEAMAELLNMSRSTLLRKTKQVFGRSPVDLVRVLRLKKAADLMNEGGYRVSDIGYMVGFSSASYFSKSFQKQFGMSPKEFAKHCREGDGVG